MSAKPLRTASPRSVTSFGEGDFVGIVQCQLEQHRVHHALHFSPRAECLWLLHIRGLCRRSSHRRQCPAESAEPIGQSGAEECPSVSLPHIYPHHDSYILLACYNCLLHTIHSTNHYHPSPADITKKTTESKADHTTTAPNAKNTPTSPSTSKPTSPPSSTGTPNKSSPTSPPPTPPTTPKTYPTPKSSSGTPSSLPTTPRYTKTPTSTPPPPSERTARRRKRLFPKKNALWVSQEKPIPRELHPEFCACKTKNPNIKSRMSRAKWPRGPLRL